jgi:copper chaperone
MTDELTLTVTGMTCGGCESAVKRVLSTVPGVSRVHASHATNTVAVSFDPAQTTRQAIASRIESAGYRVQA